MNAIAALTAEHRLILQVVTALENYAGKVATDPDVDREDLPRFVEFISIFADACHHGKEEHILFATMIDHGFSAQQGPVAVMLAEHTHGRELVAVLRQAAGQTSPWSESERNDIVGAALGYVQLLRNHIHKEDHILYPAAENQLGEEIMEQMSERFEQFERTKTGPGEHERLHALANLLVGRYAADSQVPPACHHHQ
jgi:hemerythrin-like domain-containing protein